jgi:hypothetical protein
MPHSGPPSASGGQQASALMPGGLVPETSSQPARGTGPLSCAASGEDRPCSPRLAAGNRGMTAKGDHTASERLADVAGGPPTSHPLSTVPAAAGWRDQAVVAIYRLHYGSLVRQAARLVRDIPTAEDVVQDSFIAMHTTCPRLEDDTKALPYLRQAVANRSRSVLRHRAVVDEYRPPPRPDVPQRRGQCAGAARTLGGDLGADHPGAAAAAGAGPEVFRRHVRSTDRGRPRNQQERSQNTHNTGPGITAASPKTTRLTTLTRWWRVNRPAGPGAHQPLGRATGCAHRLAHARLSSRRAHRADRWHPPAGVIPAGRRLCRPSGAGERLVR